MYVLYHEYRNTYQKYKYRWNEYKYTYHKDCHSSVPPETFWETPAASPLPQTPLSHRSALKFCLLIIIFLMNLIFYWVIIQSSTFSDQTSPSCVKFRVYLEFHRLYFFSSQIFIASLFSGPWSHFPVWSNILIKHFDQTFW